MILSRQRDEAIMIGKDVQVTVVDIRGDKVRLDIDAPKQVLVHRKEVYDAIRRENSAAQHAVEDTHMSDDKILAPPVSIRLAHEADLPAINKIYNDYVLESTCTYQEEPSTVEERAVWFAAHDVKHPITVAERDGEIVGWGSLSKFHPRSAYARTVENSVYIRHDCRRQRIGETLLADLMERATQIGHHTILALIDTEQRGSIALHEKYGFTECGRLREVGFKFGRWLDVVYLQRRL
jgi:carbon storage regulator CsrA